MERNRKGHGSHGAISRSYTSSRSVPQEPNIICARFQDRFISGRMVDCVSKVFCEIGRWLPTSPGRCQSIWFWEADHNSPQQLWRWIPSVRIRNARFVVAFFHGAEPPIISTKSRSMVSPFLLRHSILTSFKFFHPSDVINELLLEMVRIKKLWSFDSLTILYRTLAREWS